MESGITSSPYSLLADEMSAACWAGRPDTLKALTRLSKSWFARSDSTLDLMWANLGAGKTHTLLHLGHLLSKSAFCVPSPIVAFVEVPEHLGHFTDLYRRIVLRLPIRELALMALSDRPPNLPIRLEQALRAVNMGNTREANLAMEWITGGRPALRDLKAVTGIDSRIETDFDAEIVLSGLIDIGRQAGRRIVVLLDEFQRVGHLSAKNREGLLSHLRSLFSHNPTYFSVILAVGSRVERTAVELLPGELKTIIGMRRLITLPEMNESEAEQFIIQRLKWFSDEDKLGGATDSFTTVQITQIVDYIAKTAKARLIPRTILQVLGIVSDALSEAPDGNLNAQEVNEVLSGLNWNLFDSA